MKMTKRIFITLLVVAVMVSSFAVSAAASDAEYTLEDYANVLEYFEEETLINYDFTAEEVVEWELSARIPANVEQELVSATDDGALFSKYLSLRVKEASNRLETAVDNPVYFAWSFDGEEVDDFNIDMTVSGSVNPFAESERNLPRIVVVVDDSVLESLDNADNSGYTIAAIDYRAGCFTYLKTDESSDGSKNGYEYVTDYTIEADAWYSVSITYNTNGASTITVTNCADPEDTITVDDGYIPCESVKDIRIGAHGRDNGTSRGTEMKFADVRVLGGIYHRDPSNKQADVEEKLLAMYDLFNDGDSEIEQRITVCEIAAKIKGYGFTTENVDVQVALDELGMGAVALYNSRIENGVQTVDTLPTYAEKRMLVDECLGYVEILETIPLTEAETETLAKNKQDICLADEKLKAIEAKTLEFIEAVNLVKNSVDIYNYPVAKECSDNLSGYTEGIDVTYEGAEEAYSFYVKVTNAYKAIAQSGDKFIEAVNTAGDETLDINTRADAFRLLYDAYYDNETYPGVTEAIEKYNEFYSALKAEIDCADSFIMYVNKANYAAYVTAKIENLDKAYEYIDKCNEDYRGVVEAKALYEQIRNSVNEQIDNAKAYVAAVNSLTVLNGDELIAGIQNAKKLQEKGNVLGVEGVTDANILLEQLISSMELTGKYSEYFIRLVNSLDGASTAAELYHILTEAKAAEACADQRHDGVSEASEKLQSVIDAYNRKVMAANNAFVKANDTAANTCGFGNVANTNTVKNYVVALIKKFFDEEE